MRPVVWSQGARRDYLDILRYIARDNPIAAEKVADAIEKAGHALGDSPSGRRGRVTGTYEKLVGRLPCIIAYAVTSRGGRETIAILRVIHAARDWPAEDWPD